MKLAQALATVFGCAAMIAWGHAGILAWSGDTNGALGPALAGLMFGFPGLFMGIFAFGDSLPNIGPPFPYPPPPPPDWRHK